jgi:hypothetical protein
MQVDKELKMDTGLTAIEVNGTVDENQQLQLDTALPIHGPKRVRVFVLYSADEWNDSEWLLAATRNAAFAVLNDPAEDIYTFSDGQPFNAQA